MEIKENKDEQVTKQHSYNTASKYKAPIHNTYFTYHTPDPEEADNYPSGKQVVVNNEKVTIKGNRLCTPQGWQYMVESPDGTFKVVDNKEIKDVHTTSTTSSINHHIPKTCERIAKEQFDSFKKKHEALLATCVDNYITNTYDHPESTSNKHIQNYKATMKRERQCQMNDFTLTIQQENQLQVNDFLLLCKNYYNQSLLDFKADLLIAKTKHESDLEDIRQKHQKALQEETTKMCDQYQKDLEALNRDLLSRKTTAHHSKIHARPPHHHNTKRYPSPSTSHHDRVSSSTTPPPDDSKDTFKTTNVNIFDNRYAKFTWNGKT